MEEGFLFKIEGEYFPITPGKLPIIVGGVTYVPTIVKWSKLSLTENFAKSQTNFTFPITDSLALRMLQEPTSSPIMVSVFRDGDPYYVGRVNNITATISEININCDSIRSDLKHAGKNPRLGLGCRHEVYSAGCGLNKATYTYSGTVTNISGYVFTGPFSADNTFTGGYASINGQTRGIIKQIGTEYTLYYPFNGIQSGTMTLVQGCDLTFETCHSKNNTINFGGNPYYPIQNPFSETGAL